MRVIYLNIQILCNISDFSYLLYADSHGFTNHFSAYMISRKYIIF